MGLNLSSSLLVSTLLKHISTKQYEFSNKISFKKKEGPLFPRDTSNYFSSFYAFGNLNSVPNLPQYQYCRQYHSNHRSPILLGDFSTLVEMTMWHPDPGPDPDRAIRHEPPVPLPEVLPVL